MAYIVAVEATYAGLRAGLLNTDELTTTRPPLFPPLDPFEGEFWSLGADLSSLGDIARSGTLLSRILASIQKVAKDHEQDVVGVGITFSAAVDRTGVVHLAHEQGYFQVNILVPLRNQLFVLWNHPVEVVVENRSNMGAWGEYRLGQGAMLRNDQGNDFDAVYFTISANINVGIIIHGNLYLGLKGYAGQMGHLVIDPTSARQCPACGRKGCASELVSGRALVHDVQEMANGGTVTCITSVATAMPASEAAKYDPGYMGTVQDGRTSHRIDARSIVLASMTGTCAIAENAMNNLIGNLAKLVEEITYTFDPYLVVLGGIAAWRPSLDDEVVARLNLRPFMRLGRNLLPAHLSDRSALYGVGLWVEKKIKDQGSATTTP
jgi:predicted NBD/HSP70 family sugar kinase